MDRAKKHIGIRLKRPKRPLLIVAGSFKINVDRASNTPTDINHVEGLLDVA